MVFIWWQWLGYLILLFVFVLECFWDFFPITAKLIIDGLFEERLDNDANVKNKTKKCQVYLFLLELDKLYTKTLD